MKTHLHRASSSIIPAPVFITWRRAAALWATVSGAVLCSYVTHCMNTLLSCAHIDGSMASFYMQIQLFWLWLGAAAAAGGSWAGQVVASRPRCSSLRSGLYYALIEENTTGMSSLLVVSLQNSLKVQKSESSHKLWFTSSIQSRLCWFLLQTQTEVQTVVSLSLLFCSGQICPICFFFCLFSVVDFVWLSYVLLLQSSCDIWTQKTHFSSVLFNFHSS